MMAFIDCPPARTFARTFEVVEEQLAGVTVEWSALLRRDTNASPFLQPSWLRAWLADLAPAVEPLILGVRDSGRLLGVMPLMRSGSDLLFAGDSEICDYFDVVSSAELREAVLQSLLADLERRPWLRLVLWGIRADSPTLALLPALAARAGLGLEIEREAVCPRVLLPETWDEYLLGLTKKDRHELRRKIRRLGEAGAVREYVLRAPADIAAALPDFFRLHRLSRRDKAEFMTPAMEQFFRSICTTLAEEGSIRLYFLELDGRRVATVLAFDCADELWLYNSGFDPSFSFVSVGLVSKAMALRQAIAEGKRCYDLLRGAEPYKYDLGGRDLEVYRCIFTRASRRALEPDDASET